MADKLRLGSEVRELKIGQSFSNRKGDAFHTIRYDFKPASVDINKMATVDAGNNNQITVTVPHLDGAGVPQTVFRGSQRPFQKECVLILDRVTGQFTLEKLSANIQVKKTRSESSKPSMDRGIISPCPAPAPPQQQQQPQQQHSSSIERTSTTTLTSSRPQTPPIISSGNGPAAPQVGQRQSNKTRMTTGNRRADRQMIHLVPKHSPLHASPNPNYPSPGHNHKSPKRDLHNINNDSHSQSTLASLPMIGIDDFSDNVPNSHLPPQAVLPLLGGEKSPPIIFNKSPPIVLNKSPPIVFNDHHSSSTTLNGIGEMSDSSSSDSSSDSDSDHDSNAAAEQINSKLIVSNGHSNGVQSNSGSQQLLQQQQQQQTSKMSMPNQQLLSDDLCLSESGSDSD